MKRRDQIAVLAGLLMILPVVAYKELGSPAAKAVSIATSEDEALLHVEDPELRLDLLERLKKFGHDDIHRNIFTSSASLPPRPGATPQQPAVAGPVLPASPPGPPPLVVPAHFFGYVTDARTGVRRAFFTQDQDSYVLGVGELLADRFRLVQIGDNTAELEETATGRRTTVPMEDGPAQAAENPAGFPQVATGVGSGPSDFHPTDPGQNQVSVAQGPAGVGFSPPGFRPSQFGQKPAGFPQMPISSGPTPLPVGMNPRR